MIFARRNHLPSVVKVNKAGGISMLSFVRHLGLPDDVEFEVSILRKRNGLSKIVLTAVPRDANNSS